MLRFICLAIGLSCLLTFITASKSLPSVPSISSDIASFLQRARKDDKTLRYEVWTSVSKDRCDAKGGNERCIKVTTFDYAGEQLSASIKHFDLTNSPLIKEELGFIQLGPKLYPVFSPPSSSTLVFVATRKMKQKNKAEEFKTKMISINPVAVKMEVSELATRVIPTKIWDTVTGGNCCVDCINMHNRYNFSCFLDAFCCAGGCDGIIRPDCPPTNFPPDDGDNNNDSNCDEGARSVNNIDVQVEHKGKTYQCKFSGVIASSENEGECEDAFIGQLTECREINVEGANESAPETASEGGDNNLRSFF